MLRDSEHQTQPIFYTTPPAYLVSSAPSLNLYPNEIRPSNIRVGSEASLPKHKTPVDTWALNSDPRIRILATEAAPNSETRTEETPKP